MIDTEATTHTHTHRITWTITAAVATTLSNTAGWQWLWWKVLIELLPFCWVSGDGIKSPSPKSHYKPYLRGQTPFQALLSILTVEFLNDPPEKLKNAMMSKTKLSTLEWPQNAKNDFSEICTITTECNGRASMLYNDTSHFQFYWIVFEITNLKNENYQTRVMAEIPNFIKFGVSSAWEAPVLSA